MNRESNFPIDVYCKLSIKDHINSVRLNPTHRLLNILDQNHVSLKVPSTLFRKFGSQRLVYSFTDVLDGDDSNDQTPPTIRGDLLEKIALPLARNLVEERSDGLLVSNGIDESAETGCARRGGQEETLRLFQLVIESVLKLIEADHHTKIFKASTKSNLFKTKRHQNRHAHHHSSSSSCCDDDEYQDQLAYSLFASCVELRNDEIYDLFSEGGESKKLHLGRDTHRMVFAKEANQIEIESAQHAIDLLDTMRQNLEPESSFLHEASTEHTHSHVVLTLRLVQANLADKIHIKVSQLTLVDLARFDRSSRVKPNEAKFLNESSMALRNCLEIYKDNALNDRNQTKIPYKGSKLTTLLKNCFEPGTMIKLVLCFDKNSTQFEKIFNVLKFANLTSDRQNANALSGAVKPLIDSDVFRSFIQDDRIVEANENFVPLEVQSPNGETRVEHLMSRIEQMRVTKIQETTMIERQITDQDIDTELGNLKNETNQYEAVIEAENEAVVEVHRNQNEEEINDDDEDEEEEAYINRQKEEVEEEEEDENNNKSSSSNKRQAPLAPLPPPPPQQLNLGSRLLNSSARFCGELIGDGIDSATNTANECFRFVDEGVPVGSRRNQSRRPHSADVWLDHRPRTLSKLDTVLQPKISRKRSVNILQFKDTKKSSKYLLTHQQQDEDGEIKTNLIKGDILRSVGGGSNVIFTDVEILRVKSPKPERFKREVTENKEQETDSVIETRCAIGIEGHRRLRY